MTFGVRSAIAIGRVGDSREQWMLARVCPDVQGEPFEIQ